MKIKKIKELKPKIKIVGVLNEDEKKDFDETHEGHFDETPSLEFSDLDNSSRSAGGLDSAPIIRPSSTIQPPPARPVIPVTDESDETRNESRDQRTNDFRDYEIQRTFGNEANRYQPAPSGTGSARAQAFGRRTVGGEREFVSNFNQPGLNSTQSNSNDEKYTIERGAQKREKKGHGYAWEE